MSRFASILGLTVVVLCGPGHTCIALAGDATRIIQETAKARPADRQLAIFNLDWEPTLDDAMARAKTEQRPIFFVHVTNITGPSRFFSGHC